MKRERDEPPKPPRERLEELRRLAQRHGIPVESLELLAVSQRRAAKLMDVSLSKVEKMCARGELEMVRIGGMPRIMMVELLEYLERNRYRRGTEVRTPDGKPKSRSAQLIEAMRASARARGSKST